MHLDVTFIWETFYGSAYILAKNREFCAWNDNRVLRLSRDLCSGAFAYSTYWTFFIHTASAEIRRLQSKQRITKVQSSVVSRAQFHGSAYRRILRLRSRFPAYVQAPNFCASLVSVECLVTWSTHAQKPKFAANPWNTLAVSTEFPASVSADSVLTVSRAMKLGPELLHEMKWN